MSCFVSTSITLYIKQVRDVLFEHSPCPPEIDEIILMFLQWLCENQRTRNDIWYLPADGTSYAVSLHLKINLGTDTFFYKGEVEMTRIKTPQCHFKITINGIHYEVRSCCIYYDTDIITFNIYQQSEQSGKSNISLLPYKFTRR